MSEEVELVSDVDGPAVLGKKSTVGRNPRNPDLLISSREFDTNKLSFLAQVPNDIAGGIAEATANWTASH